MPAVSLREVVEALDLQSDELQSCLDTETGEIITFNAEEARIAESGQWGTAPEWMLQALPRIKRALDNDRVLKLPDRAHIDEWRMMQDFAAEDAQCQCCAELQQATHGPGAFREFKSAIQRLGLEDTWYRYREAAFERVAKQWLDEHQIPYR